MLVLWQGRRERAIGREGFETKVAGTVAESLALAPQIEPDLVLLDVMLPDGSGFDVCRELRRRSPVPIIMLTARGEEAVRVVGLELGADDYVVKPFSAREVVARIRAVLRRTESSPGRDRPSRSRSGSSASTRQSGR
jgi:DNA-binding response OmpR family regulator